jgi:hypothetical protein
MTTLPTPAELRELADGNSDVPWLERTHKIQDALRQFATLIESAELGVTDEVVNDLWNDLVYPSFRGKLLAIAPHLALHGLTSEQSQQEEEGRS